MLFVSKFMLNRAPFKPASLNWAPLSKYCLNKNKINKNKLCFLCFLVVISDLCTSTSETLFRERENPVALPGEKNHS